MKKHLIYRYLLIALLSVAGVSQLIGLSNAADRPGTPNTFKTQNGNPQPPIGPNQVQIAPLAVCAAGFNKTKETKETKGPTGALYNFQCTTPVITCPKNPSFTMSSLDVEIISNNPEQAAKQIRYTCKYWTPAG